MKPDTYLKSVLTLIALCLTWICLRDVKFITPPASAEAAPKSWIASYRLGWNLKTNRGTVEMQRADNNGIMPVTISSAADLAAWMTLLDHKPVSLEPGGWVYFGSQLTGEAKVEGTRPDSVPTSSGEAEVGVAECDNFLTAYENCVSTKVPEVARLAYRQNITIWRTEWKRLADNPQTRDSLPGLCRTQLETARTQMKAFGCTF